MRKTIYRVPPFPSYDIEAMESWLTDLAGQGLFLEKEGLYWGLARFQRGQPQALAHRLISAREDPKLWQSFLGLDRAEPPDPEVQDLHARYGWEFMGVHTRFHLYRATTEQPRELHTDPVVQADTLHAVYRQVCFGQLGLLLVLLLCVGYLCFSFDAPFWGMLYTFPWSTPLFLLALPVALLNPYLERRYYRQLVRKGHQGQPPDHRKGWAGQARRNLAWKGGCCLLAALVMASWLVPSLLGRPQVTLGEEGEALPFATLAEVLPPEGTYEPEGDPLLIKDLPSYLFPQSLRWVQAGTVTWPDGREDHLHLNVAYCRAATTHGAQWQLEQLHKDLTADWQEVPFPLADCAAEDKALFRRGDALWLLARKGGQVLSVRFDTTGELPLPLAEWCRSFLACLA